MRRELDAKDVLRKSGCRVTSARIAVLEMFQRNPKPLSVQEVIAMLPRDADQATVYRTIRSLRDKGILRQIDLRHNHAHYELANLAEHHHLVCVRCGRIEDVHGCTLETAYPELLRHSKHFAEITQHALEFYGVCKSCIKISS